MAETLSSVATVVTSLFLFCSVHLRPIATYFNYLYTLIAITTPQHNAVLTLRSNFDS